MHDALIGTSPAIEELRRQIQLVVRAARDLAVLITGPTGSGKELVARTIHDASGARGPYEPVNCAGFPASLLDSELFGHEAGAFTDARTRHAGACERAGSGMVMLDEIGDLQLESQGKLLRLLEQRRFRPFGSRVELELQARIVAATNVDLVLAIREGRFRLDLYHRLGVRIVVPSLSQRRSDIPALAEAFAARIHHAGAFAPSALAALAARDYSGEVRELKNLVETLVYAVGERPILASHIGAADAVIRPYDRLVTEVLALGGNPEDHVKELHLRVRDEVLRQCGGRLRKAANVLGLNHATLIHHVRRRRATP